MTTPHTWTTLFCTAENSYRPADRRTRECRICGAVCESSRGPLAPLTEDAPVAESLDIFAHPKQAPSQPVRTSEDAAVKIEPKLSRKRRALLLYLCAYHAKDGATDNQLIRELSAFGWNLNGVRPRRVELFRGGWLHEDGEVDGSTIWTPSAKALAWFKERKRAA